MILYKTPYQFKDWFVLCDKLDKVIEETNKLQKTVRFKHINKTTIYYPSNCYVFQATYKGKKEYIVLSNSKYQYDPRPDGEYIVANARYLLNCFKDFSEL